MCIRDRDGVDTNDLAEHQRAERQRQGDEYGEDGSDHDQAIPTHVGERLAQHIGHAGHPSTSSSSSVDAAVERTASTDGSGSSSSAFPPVSYTHLRAHETVL